MEQLSITRDLRLTFPLATAAHGIVHVYSLPIARAVFETYVLELGETYSKCFGAYDPKHVAMTAPQMALPALRAIATRLGTWDGPGGVQNGLVNELARLTTVAHATETGWAQLPIQLAQTRGILDEDDAAEVLSSLVFFSLVSRAGPRQLMDVSLRMAGAPRDWQFTSSDFTAWLASLPTSTPARAMKKKPSSVIA